MAESKLAVELAAIREQDEVLAWLADLKWQLGRLAQRRELEGLEWWEDDPF